jgi:hypothetical protein
LGHATAQTVSARFLNSGAVFTPKVQWIKALGEEVISEHFAFPLSINSVTSVVLYTRLSPNGRISGYNTKGHGLTPTRNTTTITIPLFIITTVPSSVISHLSD